MLDFILDPIFFCYSTVKALVGEAVCIHENLFNQFWA